MIEQYKFLDLTTPLVGIGKLSAACVQLGSIGYKG